MTIRPARKPRKQKMRLTRKKCAGNIHRMETPRAIIEALGREAIATRLDVTEHRVRRALIEDRLPASWYVALSDMAGGDLPKHLFSFKGAA